MKTSFIIFAAFALLIFSTDVIKSQENRKNKDNFVFASTMGYWSNLHNSNNGNIYSQSEMGYGFKIKDRIFLAGKIAYRNYGSFNKRIGLGTSIIYCFFNNNLHPFFELDLMAHFTEVDFYSNSGYYNYYNNFFGASSKFYCGLLYRIPNKSLAFYLKYGCGIELFEAAAVSIGDSGVNVQSENYKLHFENYLQLGFAYFF